MSNDPQFRSAFPDDGEGQLGDYDETNEDRRDENTVVDEDVREGLDNAIENAEVRTRDNE